MLIPFVILACSGEAQTTQPAETTPEKDPVIVEQMKLVSVAQDSLPEACTFEGELFDAYSWYDKNNKNYLIRSSKTESVSDFNSNAWIYVYIYNEHYDGTFKKFNEVRDSILECEFDILANHIGLNINCIDVNEDGIAEITVAYRLDCFSDVSPRNQKLYLFENGNSYKMEGYSYLFMDDIGGNITDSSEMMSAPTSEYYESAKRYWENVMAE